MCDWHRIAEKPVTSSVVCATGIVKPGGETNGTAEERFWGLNNWTIRTVNYSRWLSGHDLRNPLIVNTDCWSFRKKSCRRWIQSRRLSGKCVRVYSVQRCWIICWSGQHPDFEHNGSKRKLLSAASYRIDQIVNNQTKTIRPQKNLSKTALMRLRPGRWTHDAYR